DAADGFPRLQDEGKGAGLQRARAGGGGTWRTGRAGKGQDGWDDGWDDGRHDGWDEASQPQGAAGQPGGQDGIAEPQAVNAAAGRRAASAGAEAAGWAGGHEGAERQGGQETPGRDPGSGQGRQGCADCGRLPLAGGGPGWPRRNGRPDGRKNGP